MTKIGLIQMNAEPLEVQANLSKAKKFISQTVQDGAEIVVLPEMFNVGFSTNALLCRSKSIRRKNCRKFQRLMYL